MRKIAWRDMRREGMGGREEERETGKVRQGVCERLKDRVRTLSVREGEKNLLVPMKMLFVRFLPCSVISLCFIERKSIFFLSCSSFSPQIEMGKH